MRDRQRQRKRLRRQFDALGRTVPQIAPMLAMLQTRPMIFVRVPVAAFMLVGGMLAILPVFGLWMIPVGLLLLAIDLPHLRPWVTAMTIRLRRRWRQGFSHPSGEPGGIRAFFGRLTGWRARPEIPSDPAPKSEPPRPPTASHRDTR